MPGFAPKPNKIRQLEGVPGHSRPLNHKEPQPTGPLVKPDFVTGEAAKEWERAVGAMPEGLYTAADAPVLAVYCVAWVLFRNSLAQVAREGMTSTGSTGQMISHPALAVVAKQSEVILRASDKLGMSPSARTRLTMETEGQGGGKFDGLLGGAPLKLAISNGPKGSSRSSSGSPSRRA
jgi:P27 family predicted phage terminase small subunit